MMSGRAPDLLRGKASGFTLIEVLVTVVILSIGLTVILRAYSSYVSALEHASDVLISQLLIDEALDDVRFGLQSRQGLVAQHTEVDRLQSGITYTVETIVSPAQNADHDSFFDVHIRVQRQNDPEIHEVSTLVRQPGQGVRGHL
jgi:prepilin-type N-terminal cleavage/methylation domain-containing protein